MTRTELPIEGMTCDHCVRAVTAALTKVPGVRSAKVSLSDGKAVIESTDGTPARQELAAAVEKAGYHVPRKNPGGLPVVERPPGEKTTETVKKAPILLNVEGMTCASCIRRVETALAEVPGVRSAR